MLPVLSHIMWLSFLWWEHLIPTLVFLRMQYIICNHSHHFICKSSLEFFSPNWNFTSLNQYNPTYPSLTFSRLFKPASKFHEVNTFRFPRPVGIPCHLSGWLLKQRQVIKYVGKDVEKNEHLDSVGRGVGRKSYRGYSKIKQNYITLQSYYWLHNYVFFGLFILVFFYTSQDAEAYMNRWTIEKMWYIHRIQCPSVINRVKSGACNTVREHGRHHIKLLPCYFV